MHNKQTTVASAGSTSSGNQRSGSSSSQQATNQATRQQSNQSNESNESKQTTRSTNKPITNQPINQPINQPSNHHRHYKVWLAIKTQTMKLLDLVCKYKPISKGSKSEWNNVLVDLNEWIGTQHSLNSFQGRSIHSRQVEGT